MIEILIHRQSYLDLPYATYNPKRNGNWLNAFGGGKKRAVRETTGKKVYTHRSPVNVWLEIDND